MARPQKQTVDYFPHDASASEGDTLTILQSRFGNDGYAFWFKLLEKISSSENHIIDCRNPIKWQLLLAKTSVNEEKGLAIMDLLCELEAIDAQLWRENKIIWCQKLVDNIADVYKNRSRPVPERPYPTTNNLISGKKTLVSITDNPQSKVKYSKEKKERVKKPATAPVVSKIFAEMKGYLGYPEVTSKDPIPNYGKEGNFINRMLSRGFTSEEIMECWKAKVNKQGGHFVSMVYVNEDIRSKTSSKDALKGVKVE